MLIGGETREVAEAAADPSPLGLEALRAARELHQAEAALKDGEDPAALACVQQAQARLEVAVERFCAAEQG